MFILNETVSAILLDRFKDNLEKFSLDKSPLFVYVKHKFNDIKSKVTGKSVSNQPNRVMDLKNKFNTQTSKFFRVIF
jgi:hypothetical protein